MTLPLALLWHRIATDHPDRPALVHGDLALSWADFDAQAAALAGWMCERGVVRGDVAALVLDNHPQHLVALSACLRVGVVPASVNYLYRPAELAKLLHLLKPVVVFHEQAHSTTTAAARALVPSVRHWIATGAGAASAPGSVDLETLLATPRPGADVDCRADDVLIKCTGGTTGAPSAVRWRVSDVADNLQRHNPWLNGRPESGPWPISVADARLLAASPLMHGSGQTRALGALGAGGTVITVPRLSPSAIWQTASAQSADTIAITGDAMARPLAAALERAAGRWPLPDLATITSSATPWRQETKQRLLKLLPHVELVETLGSTEATGLGASRARAGQVPTTGQFTLGINAHLLAEDGRRVRPGEIGRLAVTSPLPLGLHPTGPLPAERFLTRAGVTYLLSGDHARLLEGRTFEFLGRGEEVVNVGGEKVYAPEVTSWLMTHPDVIDALVLGAPHDVYGQVLAGLVHLRAGAELGKLRDHLQAGLAPFKVPRLLVPVDGVPRSPAGKVDLRAAQALLQHHAASRTSS